MRIDPTSLSFSALYEDAMRWRALMSSERIRVMGSAGYDSLNKRWKGPDNLHMGVEFWSTHPNKHPSVEFPQETSRDMFTAYVDMLVVKNNS